MRTLSIKLPAHRVWLVVELEETKAKVLKGTTTKKPFAAAVAPPVQPIRSIKYLNVPATVGVPEIDMLPLLKEPVTPAGRPEKIAPFPPVLVKVKVVIAVP
jgi:hypothetical protein